MAVDGLRTHHGRLQAKYEEALEPFLTSAPPGYFEIVISSTWKMHSERFTKISSDHRLAAQENAAASGIIEVRGEREVPLDDFVLEVDEWSERLRV